MAEKQFDMNDPKVMDLSFHILESIITKTEERKFDEVMQIAKLMNEVAQTGDYPEILKFAYSDAILKLGTLNDDLLNDLRQMINSSDD